MMARLPLNKGMFAVIDDADYKWAKKIFGEFAFLNFKES